MERESFVFYRSFFDSIKNLPIETRSSILTAIVEYALYGSSTVELDVVGEAILTLIRPQINANNLRYENGCKGAEYGKRGGRPRKANTQAQTPEISAPETPETPEISEQKPQENPKKTPEIPQNNPKITPKKPLENPKQTPNENENENVNVNENEEEEKNKKRRITANAALADPANEILKNFCEEYRLSRGTNYVITNNEKELSALFKIMRIYLDNNPYNTEPQMITDISDYLSQCLSITENWYFLNMSIPLIISKFNQINQILKQQHETANRPTGASNKQPATTDYEAANIIAKHFANDYQPQAGS